MSRLLRFATLIFAAAQFALPAVASVADGLSAAGGRNSAAHVESKGDQDCKPPHSADCAICRFLSGTHGQSRSSTTAFVLASSATPVEALVLVAGAAPRHGFNSRAPPAVLV